MYKAIPILFLFFLALPLVSFCQLSPSDKLKGNVRYVLEESYEGVRRDSSIFKNGKNRQFSWIFDNKMEFDKEGNMISRTFYNDDRDQLYTEYYIYKEKKIVKKDIPGFMYKYKYNPLGLITEETLISKTDTTDEKLRQRFRHDANGLLTDVWEFDMQGFHVRYQQNTYDVKGRIIKEIIKYKDGTEHKNYMYNELGYLEKMEWFDDQVGLLERTTYVYQYGRLWSTIVEEFEDGKLESRTESRYDQHGNPTYILETNANRKIREEEKISYKYDIGNNWIKKTTTINNSLFFIVERRIGYYL